MLAENPEWQERLRRRYLDLGKDELDYDDLDALEEVEWALLETLRLFPPVTAIPRMALQDWTFRDHTVPANTVVWVQNFIIQRRPDYWDDPDRFDPERFGPDREEHRRHPGMFNPYSSGPHICLGMHFSKVQVKAVLHRLLLDYQIHLRPRAGSDFQLLPLPKPVDDLPVRLERRN